MSKALLVIGDKMASALRLARPFVTFSKHIKKEASKKDIELKIISYKDVLENNLPAFMNKRINIISFFPFDYWNKNIEIYNKADKVYGDNNFGEAYERFFKKIETNIKKAYQGKNLVYFNHPKISLLERDKKKSTLILKRKGISVPKIFNVKKIKDLKKILDSGKSVYIKPRFGAMGKGIIFISKNLLITNFIYKQKRIISKKSDYGWRFHSINKKDRDKFLKILIRKKFIFEEAIEHPVYKDRIYDFRVHVVGNETPYFYAKTVPTKSPVTNWAQGGRIEKKKDLSKFVSTNNIRRIKKTAIKAAKALNLNYGGVDIILSKDFRNIYCLEAHSFPGYEKRFDMMKYIAKRIVN